MEITQKYGCKGRVHGSATTRPWGCLTRVTNKLEEKLGNFDPYLENRLRIRPVGVVSKKLIGDLNIARAIRS